MFSRWSRTAGWVEGYAPLIQGWLQDIEENRDVREILRMGKGPGADSGLEGSMGRWVNYAHFYARCPTCRDNHRTVPL